MRIVGKALPQGGTEYSIGHGRAFRLLPNGDWVHLFAYVGTCTLPVWSMRRRGPNARKRCLAFIEQTLADLA